MNTVFETPRRLHATDAVGRRYVCETLPVDAAAASAYARAVGDDPADHDPATVHPCFVVRPMLAALDRLLDDPDIGTSRVGMLHCQSDIRFLAPLVPGQLVDVHSVIADIGPYGFRDGLRIAGIVSDATGRPLVAAETLLAFPALAMDGVAERPALALGKPVRPRGPALHECAVPFAVDLPARYAAASGDLNPIHLDDHAARAAGLPGLILHGMSTLAIGCTIATRLIADGDRGRLRRAHVRFSRVALPGTTGTYRLFATDHLGRYAVTCEAGGAAIWKQSFVEIG